MEYKKFKDKIEIYDKKDFNPQHIFECVQVFFYEKLKEKYIVFPENKYAEIFEEKDKYIIKTKDTLYFENYFDLQTDYKKIKTLLNNFDLLKNPIKFGYGIRILKQDLFETVISFIISANNNIKRIKMILNNLRNYFFAENKGNYFPSYEQLKKCDEDFFKQMGCGYRSKYLVCVLKQINPEILNNWRNLDSESLRTNLISLSGIGPKVADCILLFGYGKKDVFPVDTWIHQMYCKFYKNLENRVQIRNNLVKEFGDLSGYAQQYLFYYQRSFL